MELIFTQNECEYVKDYYDFIVSKLSTLKRPDSLYLVGLSPIEKNGEYIFINYEHNLVHTEVHPSYPVGKIPVIGQQSKNYSVRIEKMNEFFNSKFYIEYSLTNIENIKTCGFPPNLLKKIIYVPPLLCSYNPKSDNRDLYDVITSFFITDNPARPRRKIISDKITSEFSNYTNIPRVYGEELYRNFYLRSKILINVHQTDFHHTFEELRVLPALLNGLIIISEDSPLKEKIPYSDYIIWASYENIVNVTKEVLNNYNFYFNKIHGESSNLKNIISSMDLDLDNELKQKIEIKTDNKIVVDVDSGFFSSCTTMLIRVIEFYKSHGTLPEVDSSNLWNFYKDTDEDLTGQFFKKNNDDDFILSQISFNASNELDNYRKLDFNNLNFLVQKYFNASDEVNLIFEQMVSKYNIEPDKTISVLYRGNDKHRETNLPSYQDMLDKIQEVKLEFPHHRLLIQSDELEFYEFILERYPDSIYFQEIGKIRKDDNLAIQYVVPNGQKTQQAKIFLAIMNIISKCSKIILNSGNVGMWTVLYRGKSEGVYQYLNHKQYVYGVYNESYGTEAEHWIKN
jgi:hypothetical protein